MIKPITVNTGYINLYVFMLFIPKVSPAIVGIKNPVIVGPIEKII